MSADQQQNRLFCVLVEVTRPVPSNISISVNKQCWNQAKIIYRSTILRFNFDLYLIHIYIYKILNIPSDYQLDTIDMYNLCLIVQIPEVHFNARKLPYLVKYDIWVLFTPLETSNSDNTFVFPGNLDIFNAWLSQRPNKKGRAC